MTKLTLLQMTEMESYLHLADLEQLQEAEEIIKLRKKVGL